MGIYRYYLDKSVCRGPFTRRRLLMKGLNLLPVSALVHISEPWDTDAITNSSEAAEVLHDTARATFLRAAVLKLGHRDRPGNMLRLCEAKPLEGKECADMLLSSVLKHNPTTTFWLAVKHRIKWSIIASCQSARYGHVRPVTSPRANANEHYFHCRQFKPVHSKEPSSMAYAFTICARRGA